MRLGVLSPTWNLTLSWPSPPELEHVNLRASVMAMPLSKVADFKQSAAAIENRLLAALPRDEYERLASKLELVNLPKNRIVYEVGDESHYGYFFNGGMTSLLAINEEGQTIEIGMVGREGFIGVPIIRQAEATTCRVMTLLPSPAMRIAAADLLDEFNRGEKLHDLLLRYTQIPETQMVQSTICNLFHPVEERLCRWLLVTQDCLRADTFDLTQENIGIMLGKHRNRISVAAGELQRKRLIDYNRRGRITIVNRKGLEEWACECYQIVRESVEACFNF